MAMRGDTVSEWTKPILLILLNVSRAARHPLGGGGTRKWTNTAVSGGAAVTAPRQTTVPRWCRKCRIVSIFCRWQSHSICGCRFVYPTFAPVVRGRGQIPARDLANVRPNRVSAVQRPIHRIWSRASYFLRGLRGKGRPVDENAKQDNCHGAVFEVHCFLLYMRMRLASVTEC